MDLQTQQNRDEPAGCTQLVNIKIRVNRLSSTPQIEFVLGRQDSGRLRQPEFRKKMSVEPDQHHFSKKKIDRPCQPPFCGQVLTCTESATSEYLATSHCLSALLGPARESEVYPSPRRPHFKKNRAMHILLPNKHCLVTLSTLRCN